MGTRATAIKNLKKAGRKPGPGRPKGLKNKFTTLKDSFLKAYQSKDGFGGDKALMDFAKSNPEKFLDFIAKLLPKEIDAKLDDKRDPPNITVIVEGKCKKI